MYLPEAHNLHAVWPNRSCHVPPPQFRQSPTTVAPEIARYLPAPHAVHVSAASPAPMAGPKYPALHVHAVLADEPAADAAFAPQARHLVAASFPVVRALYLPAWHWVHIVAASAAE